MRHPHLEHRQEMIHKEGDHIRHYRHHLAREAPPRRADMEKRPAKESEFGHLKRQTTEFGRFKPRRTAISLGVPNGNMTSDSSRNSKASIESTNLATAPRMTIDRGDDDDETAPQDVQEIWFPGCHADIGGGWPLEPGEDMSLSHAPLLWMLREARAAGCPFNEEKLRDAAYILEDPNMEDQIPAAMTNPKISSNAPSTPALQVDGEPVGPPLPFPHPPQPPPTPDISHDSQEIRLFNEKLFAAWTKSHAHDSLAFGQGTPWTGVISWRIMENMPFRRMDLRPDGTWQPIRWPLPRGEVRDIPADAWIHHSALKRMEYDKDYRPGNLIVGGGGRGIRKAPKEYGMGEWSVLREEGGGVGGVVIRANKPGEKLGDLGKTKNGTA